ncbi:DMT family transporter [Geofilum rubicundum]|nr:EamA family transporter [Geofilum rubicundum]
MKTHTKDLIHLHVIVFIYGFTAILGRLISLDATQLVWYRMLIAFVALGGMLLLFRTPFQLPLKPILKLIGVGFIVAMHWVTFFHAIKISTISVALGCLATTTLFTSFLEPALIKRALSKLEVFIGFIIIIGLYTIFQFEPDHLAGIVTGIISAFLAALFTVLNKRFIRVYHPTTISFYEMGGGFIGITLYLWANNTFASGLATPSHWDWFYLLLLGIVCTAYAYMASVKVMQTLSAYTVVLTINLEPVYGILMAFLFFGESERMSTGFYAGTLIILGAVLLFPVLRRNRIRNK